jgi:5-methylthioadenosine/S-adenosylhomocysteine deaminase
VRHHSCVHPDFYELLELATIQGARILGMEDEVGSIESGKKADIQLIDLHDPHLTPSVDFTSSLVLYGSTSSVDTVILDGRMVKEAGEITTVDTGLCFSRAQGLCEELWSQFFVEHPELRKHVNGLKPFY